MRRLSIFLFALVVLSFSGSGLIAAELPPVEEVTQVATWAQIVQEIDDPKALIFIDIDDTLIDFETHLGCKRWRSQIKKTALKDYHDPLTLYIAQQMTMVPVERETPVVIRKLQSQGYFLFPLTARERDCWYDLSGIPGVDALTDQALLNAQMDFTLTARPEYFGQMNQDLFYKGIYFSAHPLGSEKTKGETLEELLAPVLRAHPNPEEMTVFFIDDKREQCESVLSALKKLGIRGKAFWYQAAENNHRDFNFMASLIQLESLLFDHQVLSNEEAAKKVAAKIDLTEDKLIDSILLQLHSSEDPALQALVSVR